MSDDHVLARLRLPGHAKHLALVRIALGAFLVSVFLSPVVPLLLEIPAGIFPGTHSIFPFWLEQLFVRHMWPMLHLGLFASVCMTLGLFTRLAVPLLLATYLSSQNYYYRAITSHDDWIYFTFFLIVLCFARSADAWSLDRLLWKRAQVTELEAQRYRWPVELMVVWIALVYFAAGVAKLFPLRKGIIWLNGASAQRMAMYYLRDSPLFWLLDGTPFDYSLRFPFMLLSWGAVAIELSAIALLFSRKAVPFVFAAILSLHIGIYGFGVSGFATIALVAGFALLDPLKLPLLSPRRAGTPRPGP
jgi:hypothetical protein